MHRARPYSGRVVCYPRAGWRLRRWWCPQTTTIVWAIILGYIFFGDISRATILTGAAIIIAAGMIREQAWAKPPLFTDPP
jgi:hypothetical protein